MVSAYPKGSDGGDDPASNQTGNKHHASSPGEVHSIETQPEAKTPHAESKAEKPKSYEKVIARWTIILGISTVILAIATIAGAVFLWQSMINSQRAYVFIEAAEIRNFVENGKPIVLFRIKNFGTTPAHRVRVGGIMYVGNEPLPPAEYSRVPGLIAPTGIMDFKMESKIVADKKQFDAVVAGRAAIFVKGEITYIDAFGFARWTTFSKYFRGNSNPLGSFLALSDTEAGNEAY